MSGDRRLSGSIRNRADASCSMSANPAACAAWTTIGGSCVARQLLVRAKEAEPLVVEKEAFPIRGDARSQLAPIPLADQHLVERPGFAPQHRGGGGAGVGQIAASTGEKVR